MTQPVYRFAPSPTGNLHVGSARTAIFNWLLAKKNDGKFLLRIEDTDRKRSTEESIQQILTSLKWLGLNWDDQPVYQSTRSQRHAGLARQLLDDGHAFRCFCTTEELDRKREVAAAKKTDFHYDGTCAKLSDDQIENNIAIQLPHVLRLHRPVEPVSFNDVVFGTISISQDEVDDFIIQRSDGTPVYQLAVVSDDHDMGITEVIRGADHITNTPKQIALYRALNWPIPDFCHLPLILGTDKSRLSKRHGATSVEEFRQRGFLPESLVNYLSLLGWSSGDDRELFEISELIEAFDIQRVNKSNAVFDESKLLWMNSKYLTAENDSSLAKNAAKHFGVLWNNWPEERKQAAIKLAGMLKVRSSLISHLLNEFKFFFHFSESYEEKGVRKYFQNEQSVQLLSQTRSVLVNIENFTAETLESELRRLAETLETSAGNLIHPLRLALTSKTTSPGIFDILEVLGKQESIARIDLALSFISDQMKTEVK